ncbi:precorrin-6A synthase (deacetylating) [Antrihabitans sp. YC2-6]|uniref:precorrin-6A synthase (deacetylating) n=1 Tax=Antrihabitans sp. YC2-6 TaxID=2799498 RepID=UPI0018F39ED6|nr:precorrin-6A synthase (deacetylating) [Antrihabitans sp. YC2-6]MBJ8344126.1 precorrin-6A synthase (deacetylating) [Antrihabitans sp. YC2-6]
MRKLYVIGIGAGDPDQVTVQAIKAMNKVGVFFVIGKGAEKQELVDVRTGILDEHMDRPYRIVEVQDPPRDRAPENYGAVVDDWHDRRADLLAARFAELGDEDAAILVWGDPALYDSTLRIVERVRGRLDFDYEVIPGITAPQALAARHRIVLNRIGEPIHITTGRRLAEETVTNTVVMLDGECSFTKVEGDVDIWWGAYLGMPDEELIAGKLRDVEGHIQQRRAELRERKGWIMDTYLLRR